MLVCGLLVVLRNGSSCSEVLVLPHLQPRVVPVADLSRETTSDKTITTLIRPGEQGKVIA